MGVALVGDQHVRALGQPARPTVVQRDRVQHRQQLRAFAGLAE